MYYFKFYHFVFIVLIFMVFSCKPKTGQNKSENKKAANKDSTVQPAFSPIVHPNAASEGKTRTKIQNIDSLLSLRPTKFNDFINWCPDYKEGAPYKEIPDTTLFWFIKDTDDQKRVTECLANGQLTSPKIVGKFKKEGYWILYFHFYLYDYTEIQQINIYSSKGTLLHDYEWEKQGSVGNSDPPHTASVKVLDNATFRIESTRNFDNAVEVDEMTGLYFGYYIDSTTIYLETVNAKGVMTDIQPPENRDKITIQNALSDHIMSAEDINEDAKTKKELRLKRNEIFAIHGYIFNSPDLMEYFSKQPWYKPQYKNVDNKITEIEKENIATLIKLEKEAKE